MASKAMECLNLSEEQIRLLEDSFKRVSKHPDGTTLMLIAAECGLSEEETLVKIAVIPDYPPSRTWVQSPLMSRRARPGHKPALI